MFNTSNVSVNGVDLCRAFHRLFYVILIVVAWQDGHAQSSLPPCPANAPWNNCYGERQLPSGATYIGEWKEDKRHGQGSSTWPDGQQYIGSWKVDVADGRGIATWPDGDKYEGEWLKGKFHGTGTYTHSNGRTQSGEWRDGQFHGSVSDLAWLWISYAALGCWILAATLYTLIPKFVTSRLIASNMLPTLKVSETWKRAITQYKRFLKNPPLVDQELKSYSPNSSPYPTISLPPLPRFDSPQNEMSEPKLRDGLDETLIHCVLDSKNRDFVLLGAEKLKLPNITEVRVLLPEPPTPPSLLEVDLSLPEEPLPLVEPPIERFGVVMRQIVIRQYKSVYDDLSRTLNVIENLRADHAKWSEKVAQANRELANRHAVAKKRWDEQREDYFARLNEAKEQLNSHAIELKEFLADLRNQYELHTESGVKRFFYWVLRRSPVRQILDTSEFDNLEYSVPSKIIVVEVEYPLLSSLRSKSDFRGKPILDKRKFNAVLSAIYPALTLRIAHEVAVHDYANALEGIAVNTWVEYDDPVTGHPRKSFVSSLFVRKSDIINIRLETIDPIRCFNAFRGRVASTDTFDVRPVEPIVKFDRDDARFIDSRDVLATLNEGQNLAAMDWQEFEHLVRELFAKVFSKSNAEVRITQASRDKGVDAIVYDSTPITGGKVIIQAKRYVNIVDVSSVRDLYGTILNEGASKGVLVTTSRFGADSYDFAKDKPIELLDGANLLALLEQHGYRMRIDLEEARRINEAANTENPVNRVP